ncbi:hypothetical protein ACI48D_20095 [Massilia sp. LXY-6]|uniref:hypothetical protein n=1 Tax=Massilia sp. LXY-6 TaxID=3379823 RepID=UPI003EE2C3C8
MKSFTPTTTLLFLAFSATILAGCGGEPSQHDIETAVAKQQQGVPKEMQDLIPEVKNVKKVGCKADGDKAYVCDVEMEVTQLGKTQKGVGPVRFVKASDGWTATK